ncbi:20068_t:CDS:2, partial [Funneliformis geosporum]
AFDCCENKASHKQQSRKQQIKYKTTQINAIDNNIEHLPNADILDIISGDVFSFATHN